MFYLLVEIKQLQQRTDFKSYFPFETTLISGVAFGKTCFLKHFHKKNNSNNNSKYSNVNYWWTDLAQFQQ